MYNTSMKNIDARLFWERLDNIRELQGLSLTDLCTTSPGLVYRTLTQQRTRNILPNVETLVLLARALDVSLDYLVLGKEQPDSLNMIFNNNPDMIQFAKRVPLCSKEQLQLLNNMLDSWGIDKAVGESVGQGKNLA